MTSRRALATTAPDAGLTPMTLPLRELRPDDVRIEISHCGVCHSDLHQAHNDWSNTVYPCVPGHEIIGRVAETGRQVTGFRVGDLVAVGCLVDSCQQCEACLNGREQFCVAGATLTYNGRDRHTGETTYGGYADQIVVRDRFVLRVPETLDRRYAAPLLCAGITVWSPLRRYGVTEGTWLAVVGLGGLGHMAVKLGSALGADVTAVTTSPSKADDARELGASHVLIATDRKAMKAATAGFDVIIDTIPTRHDVNGYLRLLALDGTLVVLGALELMEPVHGGLLTFNNRSLSGSMIGGIAQTQELLDFCADHQVLPTCETIRLDEVDIAFKRMLANDVKYRFVIDMTPETSS